jgi:hypothetical protein
LISELHRRWSKEADYTAAFNDLGEEFDLARAPIEARTAGLSQSQLARRMMTSQSYIARIECGISNASLARHLLVADPHLLRQRRQRGVDRPEFQPAYERRRQQMRVDPADTTPV